MKKLTALFTVVAMLVCMFTFAPAASAAEMYDSQGETVYGSDVLRKPDGTTITVNFSLECHNGWLDGTFGSDFVCATMSASTEIGSCSASIDVMANYISNGSYTSESDSGSASSLGRSGMSVSIYPNTDLLSSGNADFEVDHSTYGNASGSLTAYCPTAVK